MQRIVFKRAARAGPSCRKGSRLAVEESLFDSCVIANEFLNP